MKLTNIGPVKWSDKAKKNFREITAEGWGEAKSAWDKTCAKFDGFKVGDDVDLTISENGKYVNDVAPAGQGRPIGGSAFSKGGSKGFTPDPERNASVYTSYVLDHMIDFKAMKLTPEAAVDMVFKVRELVKGKL